jgi:hypothetical protein|tara:strand:+ start:281 stop:502 length:222 start_codon:yes stop_codon:yes gene_type:complete
MESSNMKIYSTGRSSNQDENNAIGLIQLALIFARNNSNEFFSTKLMEETTYKPHELERLTSNYIYHNKLSIEE